MAAKKEEYFMKKCLRCKGKGCSVCNGTGLLRVAVSDIPIVAGRKKKK